MLNAESVLDTFRKVSEEHNMRKYADALLDSIDELHNAPSRLRIFTSEKQFEANVKSLKAGGGVFYQHNNCVGAIVEGVPYYYCFKNVVIESNEVVNPKYNSIFLGVGYNSVSFNRMNVIAFHNVMGDIPYCVYVAPRVPKCLRIGFMCDWTPNDMIEFGCSQGKTTLFD